MYLTTKTYFSQSHMYSNIMGIKTTFHVFCKILVIHKHYNDVIMGTMASQITSLTLVYSTVYSDADQRKHQSSASLAFVWGIHRGPINSPHKWPVTRKMFPFDDVIKKTDTYYRFLRCFLRLWCLCHISSQSSQSTWYSWHWSHIQRGGQLPQMSHISSGIDQSHKSHTAPVPYPTMHPSEQKCTHFCSEWRIVGMRQVHIGDLILFDLGFDSIVMSYFTNTSKLRWQYFLIYLFEKSIVFWLKFHWNMFTMVQLLPISQHWFR